MEAVHEYQQAAEELARNPTEASELRFQRATQKMEVTNAWDFEAFVEQVRRSGS